MGSRCALAPQGDDGAVQPERPGHVVRRVAPGKRLARCVAVLHQGVPAILRLTRRAMCAWPSSSVAAFHSIC